VAEICWQLCIQCRLFFLFFYLVVFFAATLHFGRGGAKFSQNCQWFMDKSLYGIENVTFLAQYRASFEGIFE
jgi:hypothetical protein